MKSAYARCGRLHVACKLLEVKLTQNSQTWSLDLTLTVGPEKLLFRPCSGPSCVHELSLQTHASCRVRAPADSRIRIH
jgi:hypothetical protein